MAIFTLLPPSMLDTQSLFLSRAGYMMYITRFPPGENNVRCFSHIWRGAGLAGKTEGLREVREEWRWSPTNQGEVPQGVAKLSQMIQIDEGEIQASSRTGDDNSWERNPKTLRNTG